MFRIKNKVKDKFLIYIGSITLFILTVLCIFTYVTIKNYLVKNAYQVATRIRKINNQKIDLFFKDLEALSNSLSKTQIVYNIEKKKMLNLFLSSVLAKKDYLRAIYLGTEAGQMFEIGHGKGFINNLPTLPIHYDPRVRSWYRNAKKLKSFFITKPYIFASLRKLGIYGISTSIPVYNKKNKFIGALAMDLTLDIIGKLIKMLKIPLDGKIVIIDNEGMQIPLEFVEQNRTKRSFLKDLFRKKSNKIQSFIYSRNEGTIRTSFLEKDVIMSFSKNRYTNWRILVLIPYNKVMKSGEQMLWIIMSFYFVLIFIILYVLNMLLNRLLNPIFLLTQGANFIRERNFDFKVNLKEKNELGILADTYNSMADEIKIYIGELQQQKNNLEKRVEERTKELLDSKNELEKLNEISKKISKSLDFDEVFTKILNYIKVTYGFEGCSLALVTEDKKNYKIEKYYMPSPYDNIKKAILKKKFPLNTEKGGLIADCIVENKIDYNNDFKLEDIKDEISRTVIKKLNIKTVLNMPVSVSGEVIGAINLTSHSYNVNLNDNDIESIKRFVNQIAVIVNNSKLYQKMENLGTYDSLTGIYNRRRIIEILNIEVSRSSRYGNHLTIMLLDVDHFKNVNDNLGHLFGDFVLKRMTDIISRKVLRKSDSIGRYGGEEFLIILPETDTKNSFVVAERVRKEIEKADFIKKELSSDITVSIGVAKFEGKDLDDFLAKADKALYEAKESGRNKVVVFNQN